LIQKIYSTNIGQYLTLRNLILRRSSESRLRRRIIRPNGIVVEVVDEALLAARSIIAKPLELPRRANCPQQLQGRKQHQRQMEKVSVEALA
jgi:hypothetical protein